VTRAEAGFPGKAKIGFALPSAVVTVAKVVAGDRERFSTLIALVSRSVLTFAWFHGDTAEMNFSPKMMFDDRLIEQVVRISRLARPLKKLTLSRSASPMLVPPVVMTMSASSRPFCNRSLCLSRLFHAVNFRTIKRPL